MSLVTMAEDEHQALYHTTQPTSWAQGPHVYPHSHHGTPAQEYSGFNFPSSQMPANSSVFNTVGPQRSMHQQLQPLAIGQMPQWPSMLNNQAHAPFQPMYHQSIQQMPPMPISGLATPDSGFPSSRSMSTPRKTLTDLDRKRMCQYAEENPNAKQTEIGARFGVERSTVSKVLRHKDKYLFQDDGSRSPVKRAKGRSPDVDRALAVWAKNQERKGLPLTDDLIREKARAFSTTSASPENHAALSSHWIEKFKLKNNLMGARSRKGSLAPEDAEDISAAASLSHTPNGTSPTSPQGIGSPSPVELRTVKSQDSLKNDSPDSYIDFGSRGGPFHHSVSHNSLNSAFTNGTTSSFSPGPLSPASPFFTPDTGTAPSPFVPQIPRPILPAGPQSNNHRSRSQTLPQLDHFVSGDHPSGDEYTPKYITSPPLDSPMEEAPDPLSNLNSALSNIQPDGRPTVVTPADTMRPPPLPANLALRDPRRRSIASATSNTSSQATTSAEEARRAMEVVLSFFQQQPSGFLDLSEGVVIGKLVQKLNLQSSSS